MKKKYCLMIDGKIGINGTPIKQLEIVKILNQNESIKEAFKCAKRFIDSHVDDPDQTEEMIKNYYLYNESLKRIEKE